VIDLDCSVCQLRATEPNLATIVDRAFAAGWSCHRIHRRLVRALERDAPSRSSVYRHLVGDGSYLAHTTASERAQHERARAQAGRELHGAALVSVKMSRSRPRGSQRLVEQIAALLLRRGLLPREALATVGIEAPGAPSMRSPIFMTPEEVSIRSNWSRR
jgi:hypothetical protein